jgi:PAS domain S-box-containing protein
MIDTIPALAWSAHPDGSAEFLNRRWLDYTGLTAEQALGWGWQAAIHPGDVEGLVGKWTSSLASGLPVEVEARICRFDGAYRWFLFRMDPLRDESGNVVKWYGTITDIDDHKRLDEALCASELSWRQIVDNIPGFVHATSATGEVEFISRNTLEYFGKPNEELKDWSRLGVVHPDDLPRVIEAWRKSIETGQDYEVEQRNRRADGVYRWFQSRGRAVRNEEGEITAWYWLNTDIEDRKKAEEALRSSQRELSVIIETMPGLVWCASPDGELSYVNRRILDYLGVEKNNLLSGGWARFLHPDDVASVVASWSHSVASGEVFEVQARLRGADGAYRWFHSLSHLGRDTEGNPARWYGVMIDVDDRKRAEEEVEHAYLRLAEAQRVSKTGSFITDLVADDHNWSEETFRIFEFDPKVKVTVHMIRDMVHPDDLLPFDTVIARGMKGIDVDFVFRIVTRLGAIKHIRGMAHVLSQIEGRPLFIGALQDVTDSKIAEETLSKARSELTHVTRVTSLGVLTASIAHEVNQPLSGVITNASTCLRILAADSPNIEGARETAKRIIRDANRASELIARLRALFARKSVTTESMDLTEATQEVIALSLTELQRNRVILRAEYADGLPLVSGDRIQLQQVISNLLRNASEAMSTVDDRPRLLRVTIQAHPGGQVCLSVEDAGVGLDPEGMDRLFQPFYTTKIEGMGIGLSVSRSIIESHQGRLWATSNEGPGATFSFSIPAIPEGVRE